jgi:hypothetical protein
MSDREEEITGVTDDVVRSNRASREAGGMAVFSEPGSPPWSLYG